MKQSSDPRSAVPTRRLTSGDNLDLSAEEIVGVLVAAGLFAVVSMNLSGPLADRIGARLPSLLGGTVMASGVVLMGAAPSYGWLVAGAAVFGLGNGANVGVIPESGFNRFRKVNVFLA